MEEKRQPRLPRLRTKKEAIKILQLIGSTIGDRTALQEISSEEDTSPFKVLVSTMLSARTRDLVTEAVSKELFLKFPDARSLSHARLDSVRKLIKPVNFYLTKAERIVRVAKMIVKNYEGSVPTDLSELLSLPGVGRKTANCVLVYAFKKPAIPVDVHVHRISNRIGLVRSETPTQTEEKLSETYEKRYWLQVNESFVRFGQSICKPVNPLCSKCGVRQLCNYYRHLSIELKNR